MLSKTADSSASPVPRGRILVFTAPSGAGKTTLVRHLLARYPERLAFSVSATTRAARPTERDGEDYYFLSPEAFRRRIANGEFLEYEEVYDDQYYGTLNSEIERIWAQGRIVVFDVEVKGATAIKQRYPEETMAVFVAPPSEEVLFARLRGRGTENSDSLRKRIARAAEELNYRDRFDLVLVNDELIDAKRTAEAIAEDWMRTPPPALST